MERFGLYKRKGGGWYLAVDLDDGSDFVNDFADCRSSRIGDRAMHLANIGAQVEGVGGWRGWLARRLLDLRPSQFDPRPLTADDSTWSRR
jgi:hypothetical protein